MAQNEGYTSLTPSWRDVDHGAVPDPRSVLLVVYDGLQPLDLVGPHEVFAGAAVAERAAGRADPYALSVVAARPGPVRSDSGLVLHVEAGLPDGPVDTLVVVGGRGSRQAAADPELVEWLRTTAPRARRVCSVCTGAFVLAAAGLLDGRTATTHWAAVDELRAAHLQVTVDPDPLFVRDGPVWTSAGVTAGTDLALALVEDDLGATTAQTVARHLVLFQRRSGGQSQFTGDVWTSSPERPTLQDLVRYIQAEPAADLRLPALADRASMSVRHLQRVFTAEVGHAPSAYVARVRVDAARRLLEQPELTVTEVARRSGFGNAEALRRAFHRRLGISPDAYRDRFRSVLTPS
jgi:transcriptional regulator GlxA family with amidase domain